MYEELVKRCKALRDYNGLVSDEMIQECWDCVGEAADAIEELQRHFCRHAIHNVHDRGDDSLCDVLMTEPPKLTYKALLHAAKKMHTWIFLHSYDEQEAYDECGLSDEMNAELGYGGRLVGSVVPPTPEDQYPPMPAGGQMEEEAE